MENVLINEEKNDVCIVIDIINMIKENDNVVIQINVGDVTIKKMQFGKEVQNEDNKQ